MTIHIYLYIYYIIYFRYIYFTHKYTYENKGNYYGHDKLFDEGHDRTQFSTACRAFGHHPIKAFFRALDAEPTATFSLTLVVPHFYKAFSSFQNPFTRAIKQ